MFSFSQKIHRHILIIYLFEILSSVCNGALRFELFQNHTKVRVHHISSMNILPKRGTNTSYTTVVEELTSEFTIGYDHVTDLLPNRN